MGDDDAVIDAAQAIRSYLDRLTDLTAADLDSHLADAGDGRHRAAAMLHTGVRRAVAIDWKRRGFGP